MNEVNLATLGFSANEIKAMYLVQEPWLHELLDAAAELDEEDRRAMLVLMQTLAIIRMRRAAHKLSARDDVAQSLPDGHHCGTQSP